MIARIAFAAALAALLVPELAHAARPFVTDDARFVDPGGCQVESFVKRRRGGAEREFWFLPACNPWGSAELTVGGIRTWHEPGGDMRALLLQAKTVLKPLETNGAGAAMSIGMLRSRAGGRETSSPYLNGIASFSVADDRAVIHANLGLLRDRAAGFDRATWGVGAEILLVAPRVFAIVETYGQRRDAPTRHFGLRVWALPNRLQIDSTLGAQRGGARFFTLGLRALF